MHKLTLAEWSHRSFLEVFEKNERMSTTSRRAYTVFDTTERTCSYCTHERCAVHRFTLLAARCANRCGVWRFFGSGRRRGHDEPAHVLHRSIVSRVSRGYCSARWISKIRITWWSSWVLGETWAKQGVCIRFQRIGTREEEQNLMPWFWSSYLQLTRSSHVSFITPSLLYRSWIFKYSSWILDQHMMYYVIKCNYIEYKSYVLFHHRDKST